MRVLLIEPDGVLSRTYSQAFLAAGFIVDSVKNASAAIAQADIVTPDIVVLELQLGRHNGIEFLHEFRSHHDWLQVPVVIHSLVPKQLLDTYISNWRMFGVRAVLPKTSTTLQQLVDTVTQALHER